MAMFGQSFPARVKVPKAALPRRTLNDDGSVLRVPYPIR